MEILEDYIEIKDDKKKIEILNECLKTKNDKDSSYLGSLFKFLVGKEIKKIKNKNYLDNDNFYLDFFYDLNYNIIFLGKDNIEHFNSFFLAEDLRGDFIKGKKSASFSSNSKSNTQNKDENNDIMEKEELYSSFLRGMSFQNAIISNILSLNTDDEEIINDIKKIKE